MEQISQQKIDEIRNAADIVEIVGECVPLQPAGKNLKGLCPFHNEKTASFFVSPEKKTFHCFGCGENGNAIMFLQKYKKMSFLEALKSLADRYHVTLETTVAGPDDKMKRLYEITEAALGFYTLSLVNLASGKPALDYLKKRGLDIHTIQYFELGFAPNDFDALYQSLKGKYQELDLLELGLIKKTSEGSYYDLFRDRVIFPIRNEYGKVVGYSGRLYQANANEPNKYVNSPFTTIFTKGENLYNLDRAQAAIRTKKRIILYEGFMDVIASVHAGLKEAVASMGTALTNEQARLIKKYADKVVLCYDGDSAGFEAMEKAIPILENAGLDVRLLILPEELDPDDFTKKYSAERYAAYFEANQIDKYEFHYVYMKKHTDLSKAADIERFKIALFTYLLKEASATVQQIYLKAFAKDAGVDVETVLSDLHHFQLSRALTRQLAEKKTGKLTDIAVWTASYKAELTLLAYYAKAREFRRVIREELPEMYCEDSLNDEILLTIDDLAEAFPDMDFFSVVPAKFSEKRTEVQRALSYKQGEYGTQELMECINTIKERMIDTNVKGLKALQATTSDTKEFMRLQSEILAQKKRKETLHGKKRNPQKID